MAIKKSSKNISQEYSSEGKIKQEQKGIYKDAFFVPLLEEKAPSK